MMIDPTIVGGGRRVFLDDAVFGSLRLIEVR
jgi:hypothetical protein